MLETLISDLRSTTKPKEKQKILENNTCDFLKYLLKATYEPFEVYHVKIKTKEIPTPGKLSASDDYTRNIMYATIEYCRESKSSKKNRFRVVNALKQLDKDAQDLLLGVLHKSWKAGMSSKTVDKVFPGLTSQFEVQLANSYLKVIKKKSYKPKNRLASYKLDGVRGVFLRLDDCWKALSRQGKEFKTVAHLKPQLELLYQKTGKTFWDGELYIPGAEFETIQGEVMSFTSGTSFDLEYRTFICGDKNDFLNCITDTNSFELVTKEMLEHPKVSKIVCEKQWMITEEEIQEELEKAFELGYEGIMLRDPDKLYDFKRSDALLKLKENSSDNSQETISDVLVLNIVIDDFPVITDGAIIYRNLLTKLIVQQKDGTICTVGSGFSLDFREYYTKNSDEIKGKVIEAKHQGYGTKGKMRFPRLFRVREDISWEN